MPYRGRGNRGYRPKAAAKPKVSGYSAYRRAQSKTTAPYDERGAAIAEAVTPIPQPELRQRALGGKGYKGGYFAYPPLSAYPNAPNQSLLPPEVLATTYPLAQQWASRALANRSTQRGRGQTATYRNPAWYPSQAYITALNQAKAVPVEYVGNEAAGTVAPIGPPYSSGDYGYGGYGYGGGGGSNWVAPPAPLGVRAAPTAAPYRGYATQNEGARWMQLLTNWRIG